MREEITHADKGVDGDSGGNDGGAAAFRDLLELAHDLRRFTTLR